MVPWKKITVLSGLTGFLLFGIIAAKPPQEEKETYKNLQVLSKKISDKDMDFVMGTFNSSLNVNCMFCHLSKTTGYNFSIDYASDSLLNKRIARDMLRMTMRLNNKYFGAKLNSRMTTRGNIWCRTCHQGTPVPILVH